MNRLFLRIVTLFLIPCLLADPAFINEERDAASPFSSQALGVQMLACAPLLTADPKVSTSQILAEPHRFDHADLGIPSVAVAIGFVVLWKFARRLWMPKEIQSGDPIPSDIVELFQAMQDAGQRHLKLLDGLPFEPVFDRQEEWRILSYLHKLQTEFARRLELQPKLAIDMIRAFHDERITLNSTALDDILGIHPKEGTGTNGISDEAILNVSTPYAVLRRVFRAVPIEHNDVIYDLGCGWGRFSLYAGVVARARKIVGIEVEASRLNEPIASVKRLGLSRVEFVPQNILNSNYDDGTVYFLYNPFSEKTLAQVLTSLERIAARNALRGRSIRIISIGGLSTLQLRKQKWLVEKPSLTEGPVSIFVFESIVPETSRGHWRRLLELCRAA